MTTRELTLRAATPEDQTDVLDLVGSVMGWGSDDAAARMWRWKHVDNPAGPSPTWVAEDDGRVVGVRVFLRWCFDSDDGPRIAVRAVDTVTHPDYRGRGLFRRLTLLALDDLAAEGVDFVFNTPNDQSRPGYLSMGWQPVSKLPVRVHAVGVTGAFAMARNRVPSELESLPTDIGVPAGDGLDDDAVAALESAPGTGLRTRRSAGYLRWRYSGHPELRYRVVRLSTDPAEGIAVVRMRRRGTAVEATVAELAVPDRRAARRLVSTLARRAGASYALALPGGAGCGVVVPRLGPLLVARQISTEPPPAPEWRLSLGDVELF
ncbi:MAG: GNAT family N-acetyltransferase [Actinomycetes bacterium]